LHQRNDKESGRDGINSPVAESDLNSGRSEGELELREGFELGYKEGHSDGYRDKLMMLRGYELLSDGSDEDEESVSQGDDYEVGWDEGYLDGYHDGEIIGQRYEFLVKYTGKAVITHDRPLDNRSEDGFVWVGDEELGEQEESRSMVSDDDDEEKEKVEKEEYDRSFLDGFCH
jgi:hypothetical protein